MSTLANKYGKTLKQLILSQIPASVNAEIYLYGSRARGTAHRRSDFDIAILSKQKLPAGLVSRLREIVEESNIPYKVDIVDLSKTSDQFRKSALKGAIKWQG